MQELIWQLKISKMKSSGRAYFLRAVFPALKALRYCDSNVLAMDKIFFLVKRADAAIEISSSMFNDEELFGCPENCARTGCEEELDEVFRERGVEYERYVLFV